MAGRYDRINGAYCKVKKRYDRIGGAWTPVKKRFDKVNGVWVPSYSSANTWTFSHNEPYPSIQIIWNDATHSVRFTSRASGTDDSFSESTGIPISYTFASPLTLHPGDTITQSREVTYGSLNYDVLLDSNQICREYLSNSAGYREDIVYTVMSDMSVNALITKVTAVYGSIKGDYYGITYTIKSADYGTFILNSTNTTEQ